MVAQDRNELATIRKRMEVVFLVFLVVVLGLALRLTYLQWFQGRGFALVEEKLQGRTFVVEANRGRITDRNNVPLSEDYPSQAIVMNPRVAVNPAATAARLAVLLNLSDAEKASLQKRLQHGRDSWNCYAKLCRGIQRTLALKIASLAKSPKEPALHGLWIEDAPTRVNPAGADAIQIVGQESGDGKGIEGLELRFDSLLKGQDGKRTVRVSALGEPIPSSEVGEKVVPVHGKDIKLTIDRDIQHFAETGLAKMAAEQSPDAATAIVMQVGGGSTDILAMANWPSYHPGDKTITPKQRRNRAVTDLFEPGSIFKVLTAAACLETGVNTHAFCSGSWTIGKRTVHCANGERHGAVDLRKMVEQSCNIAAGTFANRIGPKRMYEILDRFGVQSKTGIEFPGEEHARMLPPNRWAVMRTVNIGFGQGIQITPIQLMTAYAAIANGGMYYPPRLVKAGAKPSSTAPPPHRVMTAAHAATLRSIMEGVVTSGTGKKAKVAGYSIAGKTGTAQIAEGGHYIHGYVASFAGFLPANKPRLAILVSVWHPRKDQFGGTVAAPVFREIARQSAAYLGIPPDSPDDLTDGDPTRGKTGRSGKLATSAPRVHTND